MENEEEIMMFVIFRYNVLLLSGLCNVLLLINFSDMSFISSCSVFLSSFYAPPSSLLYCTDHRPSWL